MNAFTELLDWLWQHAPGLLVLLLIVAGCIWLAFKINEFAITLNNFDHRLTATEKLCNELKEGQKEINSRLSKIELSLNTIITYLSTKSGKFNFGENKNN